MYDSYLNHALIPNDVKRVQIGGRVELGVLRNNSDINKLHDVSPK